MTERLLQFIWHRQYFSKLGLATVGGEELRVEEPGQWNHHQGPDFLHARIRVGDQSWAGSVELHVHSSEWKKHGHDEDENYRNVVLHVVWCHDHGSPPLVPLLELQGRVPRSLLSRYGQWMRQELFIPCASSIGTVDAHVLQPFLGSLLECRMRNRAEVCLRNVRDCGMDWEEAFWRAVARAFGSKVNADAFEAVARSLPLKMLGRQPELLQVEALLIGQAGLLCAETGENYARKLFSEYNYLRKKYRIQKGYVPVHFLRMRPGNFPTVRLAQLAMLIYSRPQLFAAVRDHDTLEQWRAVFRVAASAYWDEHYRFGEISLPLKKLTGEHFIDTLLVNTVIPFIMAYQIHQGKGMDQLHFLEKMPSEQNLIIRKFALAGVKSIHCGHSQSLLELKKNWCDQLRCLDCGIGKHQLLRRNNSPHSTPGS